MRLSFAEFTLDTETRQLLRGVEEIHLSPKAFDLLSVLIEERPKVLSKPALQQHLWPSTFVSETNLPTLITELRRALGDDAHTPRFIRTAHRFGYAFIGGGQAATPAAPSGDPRYSLVWGRREFPLSDGLNVLGRDPASAVWLPVPGISRQHAAIRVSRNGAVLEDLGSKNGTFVREERVTSSHLQDGDQFRLGSAVLTLRMWPLLGDTETQTSSQTGKPRS
jgi:DNA-binding winged helix-turn-helix (wHTH) protein